MSFSAMLNFDFDPDRLLAIMMAAQYRQYPPQAGQRPQGPGPRRGVPAPAGQPPLQDPAFWAQQHQATVQQDAARRRATKPTDLDLPEGSLELAGELAVTYNNLRAHEKRIDAFMTRKMMEYQDRVLANIKHRRRCRLYIWVEVNNQPWQIEEESATFGFGPAKDATYTVHIRGKKIPEPWDKRDDSDDDGVNEATGKPNNPYKFVPDEKFASTFFRSITVEYERGKTNPDDYPKFSWNKKPMPANPTSLPPDINHSDWRFTRKSDENLLIDLHFLRDEHPERYNLSKELQYVVDELDATKSEIISRIADYVKYKKLQEDDDKRTIRCDEHLKDIFKRDTIQFSEIPQLISNSDHLKPYPPITIPYMIHVDKEWHSQPKNETVSIVDVDVWVDDPVRDYILAFTSSKLWNDQLRQIIEIDEQLALVMQKAKESVARANFFKSFSEDPIGVMQRWLTSQERDLEILLGEVFGVGPGGELPDELRRGGENSIWSSEIVREAVNYMLSKPEAMEVVRNQQR